MRLSPIVHNNWFLVLGIVLFGQCLLTCAGVGAVIIFSLTLCCRWTTCDGEGWTMAAAAANESKSAGGNSPEFLLGGARVNERL